MLSEVTGTVGPDAVEESAEPELSGVDLAPNSDGTVPVIAVPMPREPSAGFRRAKAAHQATLREREVPLPVREALTRQDAALAAKREPEDAVAEALYAAEQLQRRQVRAQSIHEAALRRARDERAAGGADLPARHAGAVALRETA